MHTEYANIYPNGLHFYAQNQMIYLPRIHYSTHITESIVHNYVSYGNNCCFTLSWQFIMRCMPSIIHFYHYLPLHLVDLPLQASW